MADYDAPSQGRSLPELVTVLVGDLADLVRKEGQLVRAEVDEKISRAAKAAAGLAVGAVLLLGAFLVLLQALVLALSRMLPPLWASVIVGALAGFCGAMLVLAAIKMIKPAKMAPDRSVRQLQKDVDLVKGQTP